MPCHTTHLRCSFFFFRVFYDFKSKLPIKMSTNFIVAARSKSEFIVLIVVEKKCHQPKEKNSLPFFKRRFYMFKLAVWLWLEKLSCMTVAAVATFCERKKKKSRTSNDVSSLNYARDTFSKCYPLIFIKLWVTSYSWRWNKNVNTVYSMCFI